jgi:catechol 2,3-dioxygenase-like lactoylglutathione lyase family enzyme
VLFLNVKKAILEATMLAAAKLVGFLLTQDYDKARAFYEGKLGFLFVSLDQFALVMSVGGHNIRISKVPNFTPFQSTVLGWEVADIHAVVVWLKQQDVACEKYPFVEDRELGIWSAPGGAKVAWFKDPDGNVLSVSQHP